MNMNFKTVATMVAISATTAIVSVWGVSKFNAYQQAGFQDPGKLPFNYAGFNNNNAPAVAVDFTPASRKSKLAQADHAAEILFRIFLVTILVISLAAVHASCRSSVQVVVV
jgi:hypothetical protein